MSATSAPPRAIFVMRATVAHPEYARTRRAAQPGRTVAGRLARAGPRSLPTASHPIAEQVPPTPELETLMRLSLGVAHLLGGGDLKAARTEFAIGLSLARRCRFDYLAMQAHTCLGLAALGVGDLVAVRDACLAAAATAADHGWQASVWSTPPAPCSASPSSSGPNPSRLPASPPQRSGVRVSPRPRRRCGSHCRSYRARRRTTAATRWTGSPPCSGRGPSSGTGT